MAALTFAGVIAVRSFVPVVASALVAILIFPETVSLASGTEAATTDDVQLRETVKNIYVVPNPYVATNELEPRNSISRSDRGDRRLYFANLPAQCTIRIYTLAGELVDTIEHKSTLDDGKAFWDLRTKDNMTIAYGLYLFHVEARDSNGKVLEQVGKFAVIK